jgi:uncharacterized membrane protein
MEQKDLKEVCPACGVRKTAFVEFKYPINQKRQDILSLHLHPISVHFPEAISVFSVGFLFLSFLTTSSFSSDLITTVRILTLFFPLAILIASLTGIYDAKIRFKKLSPPYLKIKLYLGIALFISSLLMIFIIQTKFSNFTGKSAFMFLSLINLLLSAILGRIGGSLIDSKMPG